MDTRQKRRPGEQRRRPPIDSAGRKQAAPSRSKGRPAAPVRRSRPSTAPQRRKRSAPDVVYTPPKPFSRGQLLLRLATVVAVVLALTMGMSIFFKVKTITVSGTKKYTAWDVRQASGIQEGESLLTLGKARIGGRIKAALPYVDTWRIGIKLPDTVNIEIKELDVVYAIRSQDGLWWLITSTGTVVEQVDSAKAGEYTKVLGVQLALPAVGQQAQAAELAVPEDPTGGTDGTQATDITKPVTVKEGERLAAALTILQELENNGIIGGTASVDVSNLGQLVLWYGQQFEVRLGDTSQLSYKVSCMKKAVEQMGDYQSGVLDISFTIWPDQVGYTPAD